MKLYPRNMFNKVASSLPDKEAIFIFGARQCGKTTLIKQLMQKAGEENSLYIDIEYPQMLDIFNQGIDEVLKYLRFNRKDNSDRTFVFIDEIQYVNDLSKTIKLLVDHHSDEFKLIMTGSSSALIKHNFSESLVGRKIVYELYPLNFDEFLRFKEQAPLADAINEDFTAIPHDRYPFLERLSEEYMVFGGYPKVVLSEGTDLKQRNLLDIASSYILKDIKDLFRIEKTEHLNHLIKYLAVNIGKETSVNSLAAEIGLNRDTLKSYLSILEECYIIKRLKPFYQNLSTELKKTPKVYFTDLGIRNILVSDLKPLNNRSERGELFENFVFLNLFASIDPLTEIRYWKTRNKQEIDFIVSNSDGIRAFESKFSGTKKASFSSFQNAYPRAICNTVSFCNSNRSAGDLYAWQRLLPLT